MLWIENDLGWESNSETFKITVLKSGGRLLSTKINGVEFLEQKAQQVGNTFWTSPQSDWEWPPLKEHDEDDYQGRLDGAVLMLRSSVDSKLNFRIIKEYKLINESTFSVKYGIVNHNDDAKKVAPWEITRVPALGLTEFKPSVNNPSWGELQVENKNGKISFKHNHEHELKYFGFDDDGVITHTHSNITLSKKFKSANVDNAAPGESGIEIYAAKEYVEVEQQGAYEVVEPGAILWWTVKWSFSQV